MGLDTLEFHRNYVQEDAINGKREKYGTHKPCHHSRTPLKRGIKTPNEPKYPHANINWLTYHNL